MKHVQGFSLVELPAVFCAFGVLAAILAPSVHNAMRSASMNAALSNGINIYRALFADEYAPLPYASYDPWPKEGDFSSSTEFFIHHVTNETLCVSFDFFAAEGIPPAKSCDPADFKAENNAWKLVLGLGGAREGTPCLFTRNYAISAVPVADGPITPDQLMDNGGKPFGPKGLVVIMKGGGGLALKGKNLTQQAFNPAGAPPDGHPLPVLAP